MMAERGIYRASGIHPCPRHLSAVRLGIEGDPDPPWLELAAEEGHLHEKIIKDRLCDEGLRVSKDQFEVVVLGDHPFQIVGHIDGWVKDVGWEGLLEIKTMSQFEFDRYSRGGFNVFETYANQITCYWAATGAEQCLYIVKNRSSGYLKRAMLEEPPKDIKDIIAYITEVENWVLKHGTPAEGEYNPQSIECKRCPFSTVLECVKKVSIDKDAVPQLDKAAKTWLKGKELDGEGKKLEAEGKEMMDEAKGIFEQYSIEQGLKGKPWSHGGCTILYKYATRAGYAVKSSEGYATKVSKSKGGEDD